MDTQHSAAAQPTRRDILVATPTAFTSEGALDLEGSRAILRKVAQSDVEGAFILGTTGEFPALLEDEHAALIAIAMEELKDKRVVVHVGAPSVYQVLRLIEKARRHGATSVAVLTPYYLKSSEESTYSFFKQVSSAADGLDVFAYLFAARTGNTVSPEELARIATLPNIIGAKVSGESLETIAAYRAAVPDEFLIFTGADRDFARISDFGAQGVVSGIASVFPQAFTDLAGALRDGDESLITARQSVVEQVVDALLGDPARLKYALRLQGIPAGYARMALDEPVGDIQAEIDRVVSEYA